MKNQLIYDLPTRLFHWIFTGLFLTAFLITKTVDDDSVVFSYHMLAGLLLGGAVALRLVWGFAGSTHALFRSFALRPRDLLTYMTGILAGDHRKWAGHNPASSWASLLMLACALGLGATGVLMATGQKETFEDLHELLANGFFVIALSHVAGVALHTLRHRDPIGLSMIHGRKAGLPASEAIGSARPAIALLFLVLMTGFAVFLGKSFDGEKRTLALFGTTLRLGDDESGHESHHGEHQKRNNEDAEDEKD